MNAHKFVADFGIERAKAVLEGAPNHAQRYLSGKYLKQGEWTWWWSSHANKWLQFEKHIYSDSKFEIAVSLEELKQVIESINVINRMFSLKQAKKTLIIAKAIGYTSDYQILKQAIADYESIYGGEHV